MAQMNTPLNDPRRQRPRFHLEMDGTVMKIYGCVTMFFYTLSFTVIQNGLIHVNAFGPGELSAAMEADPDLMLLSGWASVFQLVGGLPVPVFAFLLVEGFLHTSDFKRYLLTMLGFAIVSEPLFDFSRSGIWWDMTGQNVLFTYAVCLIMLYGLRLLQEKKGVVFRLGQLMIVVSAALWTSLLQCNFGMGTVLLAAVYYLLYERKGMRVLIGAAVSILYVTAPLSGYAIWNYNGQRGKLAERYKYVFYALYPAHLLILGVIARALAA